MKLEKKNEQINKFLKCFCKLPEKIFIQSFSTNKVLVPRCLFSVSAFSVRCAAMIFRAVQCYPALHLNLKLEVVRLANMSCSPGSAGTGVGLVDGRHCSREIMLGNFYRFLVYRSYCSFLHQLNQRAEWSNRICLSLPVP